MKSMNVGELVRRCSPVRGGWFLAAVVSAVVGLSGCSKSAESGADAGQESAEGDSDGVWQPGATLDDVLVTYADVAFAAYSDSLEAAQELRTAIDAFVAEPDEAGLEAAKGAWLAAREPYLQTEVYRFYQGPIDNDDDGPEGLLNAWPLDEAYIDYVQDDAPADPGPGDAGATDAGAASFLYGGLVNDRDFELSLDHLVAQNERGGEKNIAIGYHAVEFLLWGQDFDPEGPGSRSFADYLTGDAASAPNGDRRAKYLALCAELLEVHLQQVVDAWDPDVKSNYRADFLQGGAESLQKILTGMIVLSGFETGGDRLQAALDALDQEEEHSCFSDNTHRDMIGDVIGMRNVWSGRYLALSGDTVRGTSLESLVRKADAALAAELSDRLEASLELADALVPPFDQEIAPGNTAGHKRVQTLIDSLFDQEKLLSQVFRGYGFAVPQPQ